MKLTMATKAVDALFRNGLLHQVRLAVVSQIKAPDGECPVCGFRGKFRGFGVPVRTAARCPACSSLERHRLFALAVERGAIVFEGKDVLNFTADAAVGRLAKNARNYRTSNWPDARGADFAFDIESIDLPDVSYDIVVCSHVLEHVDDRKALRELYRILRPGGQLIFMVPLIEGWAETYENPEIRSEAERELHFGQFDHVRYYGADIRQRVADAGFSLSEFTSEPMDSIKYSLQRGEKVFIASKP
jgi:SAM-dependent methyltransferase